MTLSEDGQWMWDGNQWVPAQQPAAPAPAPAPAPTPAPGFSDPNNQSWDAPQGFGNQPSMGHNSGGGWSERQTSKFPVVAIAVVAILVIGGITGGILWATGVFGSSGNELVGTWYVDEEGADTLEFKSDGSFEVDGEMEGGQTYTWSVEDDTLTWSIAMYMLTEDFECDNGDEIDSSWVNDGEDDCDNGEDEGVDVSDYEHDVYSMVQNYRYVIEGDYLYMGLTSYTVTQDGSSNTMTVDEENMCSEGAICLFMWRSSTTPSEDDIEDNAPSWFSLQDGGEYAEDQQESGTRNVYDAVDASASTSVADDDTLMRISWSFAEDDLNWAFVVMKLSVGDNTYDCSPDGWDECNISQDGVDNALWEVNEFIMLSENGSDICSDTCNIDIYITYRGTQISGDSSIVVA